MEFRYAEAQAARGADRERELPEELTLYAPESDRAYLLNQVSAAVWDLCDGNHIPERIACVIAEHSSAPPTTVTEDV